MNNHISDNTGIYRWGPWMKSYPSPCDARLDGPISIGVSGQEVYAIPTGNAFRVEAVVFINPNGEIETLC